MVPVLMSRSSNETSVWRGSWPVLWDSVLMMLDGLRQFWVAQREKRALLQVKCKEAEPQSAESEGQSNVQPGGHGARSELRARHPIQIHKAHEDEPHGDLGEHSGVALHVLRKEQKKRHEEMEHQNDHGDDAPAAVQSCAIKADFLRLIAGPDDQELREIEIRPEHHESEEQFSQIVKMAFLKDAGKRLTACQKYDNRDHEGHGGDQLSRHKQKSVDSGSPVGGQGHGPVDGRKAHHKNVEDDARSGQHLEAETQRAVFGPSVLLLRQNIEDEHQQKPYSEINDGANVKAILSEVTPLKVRESAFARGRSIEPAFFVSVARIKIAHAEKRDGQESDGHERQRARGRFQWTADDDAPVAAGQMLQHDEAERADG